MTNKLPNRTFSKTLKAATVGLLIGGAFFWWNSVSAQEKEPSKTPTQKSAENSPSKQDNKRKRIQRQAAKQTLNEARKRIEAYDSLRAEILETVLLGSRRYQAKGEYVQARGNKVRLSFRVSIKGADGKPLEGSLLQVSNGEVMHSSYQVGDDLQVSRRDVVQIMKAIEEYPSFGISLVKARMGLGGLPALLASLQASIDFDRHSIETINGKQFIRIAGGWTPQIQGRLRPVGTPEGTPLPSYIPDRVHVYFDKESYFPRRVLYLKQIGKGFQPMLTLDFVNIQQNVAVSAEDWLFIPPEGAVSQDITQSIIQSIIQAHNRGQENSEPESTNSPPAEKNSGK